MRKTRAEIAELHRSIRRLRGELEDAHRERANRIADAMEKHDDARPFAGVVRAYPLDPGIRFAAEEWVRQHNAKADEHHAELAAKVKQIDRQRKDARDLITRLNDTATAETITEHTA